MCINCTCRGLACSADEASSAGGLGVLLRRSAPARRSKSLIG